MTTAAGVRPIARRRPPIFVWLTIAIVGWVTIGALAVSLLATRPPTAAFDLELLLRAGRAAAAGQSMYDPAIVAGRAPVADTLFFSYPPPVGQVLALVAAIPSNVVFAAWCTAALALLAMVARRFALLFDAGPSTTAAAAVAASALTFPYVVAILFGNLDAFFPALYGLVLLAGLSGRTRDRVTGGVALAVAAIAKIYPAGLGVWFLVRGFRERDRRLSWFVVAAAVATGLAILGVSLVAGGSGPWADYLKLVPVISRADIVDAPNVAPAARLAVLLGGGSELARTIQLPVAIAALLSIALSAWRIADAATGLAISSAATLVLLPVSWVHYPAAMIPFGILAVLRAPWSRDVRVLLGGALVAGVVTLVVLPVMWIGVVLVVEAVRRSASGASEQVPAREATPATGTARP